MPLNNIMENKIHEADCDIDPFKILTI